MCANKVNEVADKTV